MKILNKIRFVDSLAEISRHHDREFIETSLLKTLSEHEGSQEFWLYNVIATEPEISLALLAHLSDEHVITSNQPRKHNVSNDLLEHIIKVISTESVVVVESKNKNNHKIIYPAFNQEGDVFAILIQSATEINFHKQQLIYGLLRIYSNYLELIDHAKRDKLTGLLNRETLNMEITRKLVSKNETYRSIDSSSKNRKEYKDDKREYKEHVGYWLGILDIDHFKKINDSYGHLYGDEVLILVARLIEKSVRDCDLVFRFGGEEFVILLEAYGIDDAAEAFGRMNNIISEHVFAKVKNLTASIGITEITDQTGAPDIIGNADRALYYAKENGRNRVCIYEQLIEQGLLKNLSEEIETGEISFF